jgi:serine/threonine protein phosphatase PrpC
VLLQDAQDFDFCAVIEVNEKDPTAFNEGSAFDSILSHAAGSLVAFSHHSPLNLAVIIGDTLRRNPLERGPGAVLYAGVFVKSGIASVCTAGDLRVHLIRNGQVINVTRDHNLIDDPIEGVNPIKDKAMEDVYRGATTRALGNTTTERAPECLTWEVAPCDEILLCSSQFHNFHRPDEYFADFLRGDSIAKYSYTSQPLGVIVRLSVSSS